MLQSSQGKVKPESLPRNSLKLSRFSAAAGFGRGWSREAENSELLAQFSDGSKRLLVKKIHLSLRDKTR
jgi:hypothetical protein